MNTNKIVRSWLLLGAILVFMQVFIGGVTRLTESGLSITEWDIVYGTIPPLKQADWIEEFEKYKETPQYEKINEGMSLSEFKFIYFWEYFHRLWARMMGFVFLIPFLAFLIMGWIRGALFWRCVGIFFSAATVAVFGWLMVATGLEDRPWVSAYSLSVHLMLALGLLAFILVTWAIEYWKEREWRATGLKVRPVQWLLLGLCIQITLGAWMSGMKAGLYIATWPDYLGSWLPESITERSHWVWRNVIEYDNESLFMIGLVQFLHRTLAYVLFGFVMYWYFRARNKVRGVWASRMTHAIPIVTVIQVVLGIWTLVSCKGTIPVGLGSAHQVIAIVLLMLVVLLLYSVLRDRKKMVINEQVRT